MKNNAIQEHQGGSAQEVSVLFCNQEERPQPLLGICLVPTGYFQQHHSCSCQLLEQQQMCVHCFLLAFTRLPNTQQS